MPQRDYDRVELVWPGKRSDVERVRLPFQTIERVNDARRSREGQPELASDEPMPDGWPNEWRNRLIWGDNKYILSSLLDEFAGKVDLIYIDPPFATGADFSYHIQVGGIDIEKQPSMIEEIAYRDTWGKGLESYFNVLRRHLVLSHEILAPTGSFFLHLDWRMVSAARMLCDEIFGQDRFRNEIVWCYYGPSSPGQQQFSRKHDAILWFTRSKNWKFNADDVRIPYHESTAGKFESEGTGFAGDVDLSRGKIPESWWSDIPIVARRRTEILNYPTQKPEKLLTRIVQAASDQGDLVLDFFSGSGTTAAVAEKTGRRWIAADLGRYAIHTARKRLLDIPDCRPFEVQNLGRYERRRWQGANAGEAIGEYYRLVLDLYGARPVPGFAHLHGEKAGRMVHVGATDAPVTNAELRAAIEECVDNGLTALDVLGWEWEMGLNPAGRDELASHYGVDTHLLIIPQEVMDERAVKAGDVHFFELSVAEVVAHVDGREVTLELTGFLPALDDDMRVKTEGKIARWSDWIDYWSVDYEYDGETFVNQWQAYRTRREPRLALRSDPHRYAPGAHTAVAKVIDIFGNDTTCEIAVTVEE